MNNRHAEIAYVSAARTAQTHSPTEVPGNAMDFNRMSYRLESLAPRCPRLELVDAFS